MMEESRFWSLIEESRQRALEQKRENSEDFIEIHERTLTEALGSLSPQQILDFDARFQERRRNAYRWDLWAVAYWLGGGCSDDGFLDFRACLISLGQRSYDAALTDPDSLAEVVGGQDAPYMLAEGFQYVALDVYQKITGADTWPEVKMEDAAPLEPLGEQFDFEDEAEMQRRFPHITAKFPDGLED